MHKLKTDTGEGVTAKSLARDYLKEEGWDIAADNDSHADILAERDGWTLLVDVDSVPDTGGIPTLHVDKDRARKLCTKAHWYLACHKDCKAIRVDVIVVCFTGAKSATMRHLVGVFESEL